MFNKILVPLDDSDIALGILPYAVYLAKGLHIPVRLAMVLDRDHLDALEKTWKGDGQDHQDWLPDSSDLSGESGQLVTYQALMSDSGEGYSRGVIENAVLPAGRWLGEQVAQLRQHGVPTTGIVCPGSGPADDILHLASQDNCGLIAMATHDRNLLMQAIQGSVTNQVLREAQVPVLAVAPEKSETTPLEQPANISKILVPLDGSPFAEAALPYAERLARSLSLQVVLVRVLQMNEVYLPLVSGAADPANVGSARVMAAVEDEAENEIQKYLDGVARRLQGRGLDVRWEMLRGTTSAALSGLVETTSDCMIALTSHGRSGLARWVLGSVAEDLIRATGSPVLVVPSDVADQQFGTPDKGA
jgi:nucleotide-binding universal stress UspA family protein